MKRTVSGVSVRSRMRRKTFLTSQMLMAAITLLLTIIIVPFPVTADPQPQHGPRMDELLMNFYADVEGAYGALKAGVIDLVASPITYEQYLDAIADSDICLARAESMNMYEIDINNNYTMPTYPDVRNPCNELSFRQATACLLDKDFVVSTCCGGFATRIDVPKAAPTDVSWVNTSVVDEHGGVYYGNYPYKYDPWRAQQYLDDNGFVVGTTPNPYYDPTYAWSQEYLRTYPAGWDGKAGQDLDPLVACIRNDDARRLCMGRFLADNLELSGIPITRVEKSMAGLYGKVMGSMDYHWYTGDHQGLPRYPPRYEYYRYHSDFWYPWGPNYVTGVDKNGNPNCPDIDQALEAEYYCPDMAASMAATQTGQALMVEECISIWLWSDNSFYAYRNLLGLVNMDGYGPLNDYTLMNMYTVDGTRPTVGITIPPYQQHVLMSSWFYDRQVMNRYYGAPAGISMAPYALAKDQPWVIQDWTPMTWVDPEDGKNKTKVVVWFRENVEWVSPVTGAVYGRFTAHDFAFSEWFIAAYRKAWTRDHKLDIHHIKIIDDYCIEVYMESESYWLQYVGDYVINKALWQDKFCMINTTTIVLSEDYTFCEKLWLRPHISPGVGPGKGTGQILQMVDCTLDAETLVEDLHYEIVMLEDDHTYFHWLRPASAGQVLTVTYWTIDPTKDCDGFWPGEYDWEQIAVGIGTHYLVNYVPGAGGYASLKANRNFWMETFPLGEVDWIWEWGPRDDTRPAPNDPRGPRRGQYKVDIGDVLAVTAAFGSTGRGEPDPHWFPGADLAIPCCVIDMYDVCTVTGQLEIHDVAVINVTTSKSGCPSAGNGDPYPVLCQGRTAKIYVTVENQGNFTESFDVTVYANDSIIQTYTVTNLAIGSEETKTIIWNATGWTKGKYTIKAIADQVPHESEIDTPDNTFIDKWIMVVYPGDLDNSGEVDITDVVMVTGIYRAKIGDPEYNACRDVVEDGVIDISDVVAVTAHYREKDP